MMRRLAAVLALALAAACSGGDSAPVDRLVVVDREGRVVTVEPDGSDLTVLSEEGTSAFQPVWSPDATRIAWGSTSSSSFALAVADVASGEVSLTEVEANPFYLSWAPVGDRLGLLRNDGSGLAFETATVEEDGVTISTLDTGSSYYFDWRPDGERVASHVGRDRFDFIDLDGEIDEVGVAPGIYQAPQWIDRGILTISGGDDGTASEIVLADEGGDTEVIARTDGLVSFVADPAGERLAVFSLLPGGPDAVSAALVQEMLEPNTLSVVDLADGTVTEVTSEPVAVFMWSPDGEKLLVMGMGSAPGRVRWSVWSEEDGLVEGPDFAPSPHWVEDYMPFHDQYTRSMTLWSPDSGSFAFPGEMDDREGIWRYDVESGENTFVTEGAWVVWSPV
jgi:hypothetical protein